MGQEFLIDTNVISHLFANRLPSAGKEFVTEVVNSKFIISVVVEIEVLTYHEIPGKMPLVEEFVALATVLQLDTVVVKKKLLKFAETKENLGLVMPLLQPRRWFMN